MTPEQFSAYSKQGYNRIPLSREIIADLETPLSCYQKLASQPYSYLFESVHGGEQWGRYSIIGLPCKTRLRITGYEVTHEFQDSIVRQETVDDPLAYIEDFQGQFKVPEIAGLPKFNGGLVGYFAYDAVRYAEPRLGLAKNPDDIGTPDILLMVSDDLVVFDNLNGSLFVLTHVNPDDANAYEKGQQRLDQLLEQIRQPLPAEDITKYPKISEADFKSGFEKENYQTAVKRIKEYILAGDVMQVVLAQRMSVPFEASPLNLYRALRHLNPSPYLYYLNLESFHIVGSSPEILARSEDNIITVRPLAGTRKRGKTPEEDKELEKELLADPKEIAEHLMLIDLGRNDIGRVAEIGSVVLSDQMSVERYSHVMHIVSNVQGRLSKGKSPMDTLKATLPAGTLSGAPKIRAMEIIDELEPVKRGIYGGAVGYLSWHGNMDTAIAIRTAVIKDKTLHIQAGAGIVADSIPEMEWEETMNKGRAIFRAAELACNGLQLDESAQSTAITQRNTKAED
ncbi:MAG: anthranilate synthase component I [Pseudomonadales bacterium]|nr:anthranilate synthase component I [Pseudomonadales bacterium]